MGNVGCMEIGIGLPSTLPTATGADILTWAREGRTAGFSTLGTIDRLVYGNHETIATLAAAAAVTSRIRLTTAILIAPFPATARCWPSSSPPSTASRTDG